MAQYAFYFNSASCTGCKTCQVSCKENYHLPVANLYRRVFDYSGGKWETTAAGHYAPNGVFHYFISMACNHCENPACVANCPTGAMRKNSKTGIVTSNHEVCIGCKTCVAACPYGAPSLDVEAGYIIKCDMCQSELTLGRKPVCVAACPMRALDWGELADLKAKYGDGNVEIEPLPENTTNPCIIINPHPFAQATGKGTGVVVNLPEEL